MGSTGDEQPQLYSMAVIQQVAVSPEGMNHELSITAQFSTLGLTIGHADRGGLEPDGGCHTNHRTKPRPGRG